MRIDSSKEREGSRRGGCGDGVIRKYSSGGYSLFIFFLTFLDLKKKSSILLSSWKTKYKGPHYTAPSSILNFEIIFLDQQWSLRASFIRSAVGFLCAPLEL